MGFPRPHTLSTHRLDLRPITHFDAQWFFELSSHPSVVDGLWYGLPAQEERVEDYILESEGTFRSNGFGLWRIADKRSSFMGFAGLRFVGRSNRIELLYALHPTHWGSGIAHEAVVKILRYAFLSLSIKTIEASTHPANERSRALLGRVGMVEQHIEDSAPETLIVHTLNASTFRTHLEDTLDPRTSGSDPLH